MQATKTSPQSLVTQPTLWSGWSIAILSTFCFSVAAPVARGAILAGMDSTTLLLMRMVFALFFFSVTIGVMDRRILLVEWHALRVMILAGILNGVAIVLVFWALVRVDASVLSMMISTVPLIVLTLLALGGERFTYRHVIRLALGLSGLYLLIGPGGNVDPVGIMMLSVAMFFFALQVVLLQWYLRGQDPRAVSFYITGVVMVIALIAWWVQEIPWRNPGVNGWISILVLALVGTFLARLTFVAAIDKIGGGQMTLLMPLETFQTVIWSMLFLGERLSPLQWAGGALVLSSALLAIQRLNLAQWRPRWRNWARI